MPKMKRHKGLAKRVKITANGKVKYRKANMGHLMSGKSGDRKRSLRSKGILNNPKLGRKIIRALQA
jgi:large subunit ribosomal protein L35